MTDDTGIKKIGNSVTREEAENTALAVSEVIVSSIMHGGNHRYVGTAFQTIFDSEHFASFAEVVLKNITKALASGIPGFKVRHEMAQHLGQMETALREEAGRLLLGVLPAMTVDVSEELDNLIETARIAGEASRRLQKDLDEAASSMVQEGRRRRIGHQLMRMASTSEEEEQAH
jgi:hypothetical protein